MLLAVHVTPKTPRSEVVGWSVDANGMRELEIKVRSVPEKGKATKEAGALLASFFGLAKSEVTCVRGQSSRHKMFELPDSVELPA